MDNYKIEIAPAAIIKWQEAKTHLTEVYNSLDPTQEDYELELAKWRTMSQSLTECLLQIIMTQTEGMHSGPLMLFADTAPLSFFWRYGSGYHGGIIYHANYKDGERTQMGNWSIHT